MLSKKSKYSIKALVKLAKEYDKGPVLISEISESEHIPKKFLEAILLELKNAGILGSKKGYGGGYYLIKKPEDVKLTQVIRLTNGPIALLPCVSLNFYQRCEECVDEKNCGISQVAMQVRDATLAILENTSIADVLKKEQSLSKKRSNKIAYQ